MSNPILDEVYRHRDAIAKECHHDIDAICDHADRAVLDAGLKLVSRKDMVTRDKPKKVLAKQHARPIKVKKRTKTTKH